MRVAVNNSVMKVNKQSVLQEEDAETEKEERHPAASSLDLFAVREL